MTNNTDPKPLPKVQATKHWNPYKGRTAPRTTKTKRNFR